MTLSGETVTSEPLSFIGKPKGSGVFPIRNKQGKCGLMNSCGNVILDAKYEWVGFSENSQLYFGDLLPGAENKEGSLRRYFSAGKLVEVAIP